MKNFKKVLALVLVLATLLGLATMASATEYKDADKISADYTEAVKVLDLIKTMQGYPNGEFRPTATITREEAAKLIAIFDNKDSDISTYYTSINPFADEKGRWGESYVGYGYRAGIIAGMNATTFAPTANVTGTQFLKMALVTLGYDQEAEGFVGSSWAVNVLSLARKLDLIDGLADGWKAEAALTREEAAQILLNTLKADTVEYAQEAKQVGFKPTYVEDGSYKNDRWQWNSEGYWTWNGRVYLTVAGAVSTGKPLYKEFKLEKGTSYDAFERPYTKWTYDNDNDKTVEVMDSPKATFTTSFNACELLVALGVKETDTKTSKKIGSFYINGAPVDLDDVLANATLKHTPNKCDLKEDGYEKMGAQGTLTQVFKEKDDEGKTVYRICSIDTWLGKVAKVTKATTSRDNHKKNDDVVQIVPCYISDDHGSVDAQYNYADYCNESKNNKDCGEFKFAGETSKNENYVAYDESAGLAKDDYVLFTYSFKKDEDAKEDNAVLGVQSADVVTAKEGRLSGFKFANVAEEPSETRIDSAYVKDAVHFHLGYNESKDSANFGTKGFFYDAYGNVIGMKDSADTSKYTVIDKAWVSFNKGEATLYANVVGLDGKVTEEVVVKDLLNDEDDDEVIEILKEIYGKSNIADILSVVAANENYKAFYGVYDMLLKTSVNSKNEYTFTDDETIEKTTGIKIIKGKPFVEVATGKIKTTAKTQYLIRTGYVGEGKYEAVTGYQNVKSLEAVGYDIKMDDAGEYAEIVYVYGSVSYTDGKFVAYVPGNATMWKEEVEADGDIYYILKAYVDGAERLLKISEPDAMEIDTNEGNFFKFRNVDINEVTTAELVYDGEDLDTDFNLHGEYHVDTYEDGVLGVKEAQIGTTGDDVMALDGDCKIYSIRYDGNKVVAEELDYLDDVLTDGRAIHIDWSDKNADEVNKIVAIYVVETVDD